MSTDVERSLAPKLFNIKIRFYYEKPVKIKNADEWAITEKGCWTDIRVKKGVIEAIYRYRTKDIKSVFSTEISEY